MLFLLLPHLMLSAQDASIRPFAIEVEEGVLEDLDTRLAQTRWPAASPARGWEYGVDLDYMKDLVAHWRSNYNWRAWEKKLNSFPQFKTEIDGLDLHFIHARSPHADATPLVLVHGWPGSVVEFHKIIGPLTEPEKHGGRVEDAFHVRGPLPARLRILGSAERTRMERQPHGGSDRGFDGAIGV